MPPLDTAGQVKGLRIGLPEEYFAEGLDADVRKRLDATIDALKQQGATIVDVSLPHTALALPAYYIIAPAEASSNLARYDGIRFGKRAEAQDLLDVYLKTRGAGFGPEVKRRIMLGTYALRSGYYDAYYKKAQQLRALIKKDFDEAWATCDVLLTPTTPHAAYRFGAKATPMDMYLGDVYTLACNLAGLPGLSVPCGLSDGGLPIGAQLLGQAARRANAAPHRRCDRSRRRPRGQATDRHRRSRVRGTEQKSLTCDSQPAGFAIAEGDRANYRASAGARSKPCSAAPDQARALIGLFALSP